MWTIHLKELQLLVSNLFSHLQVLVHMCVHTVGDSELSYLPEAGSQNPSCKQHLSTILLNAAPILGDFMMAYCPVKG